jgi:hypothetical protein
VRRHGTAVHVADGEGQFVVGHGRGIR